MIDQKTIDRFNSRVKKLESGCWIWIGGKNHQGYGYAYWKEKGRNTSAHRLSWMIHNGKIPEGLFVCHSCDNPPCVRIDHLWLGTNKENSEDMVKKNRSVRKNMDPQTKFTIELPKQLHTDFKVLCAQNGLTMAEVVIRFIEEFKKTYQQ